MSWVMVYARVNIKI